MRSSFLFHRRNFFQGIKLTSKLALAMMFSFLDLLFLWIGGTGILYALYRVTIRDPQLVFLITLNLVSLIMLNRLPAQNMIQLWHHIVNWLTTFVARTTAIINHMRNHPVQSMIMFFAALLTVALMPILWPCYLIKLSVQKFVNDTRNYHLAHWRTMPLRLALLSSFIGFSTLIFYPFTIAASFFAASFILGKLIRPGERQTVAYRREYKKNELKSYAETALVDYRSHQKPNHYFNSYSLLFYAFYIKKDLALVKELIQAGANIHAPISNNGSVYDYFHQFMYGNNNEQDVFYRASKLTFAELVIRLAIKKEALPKNNAAQSMHLETFNFLLKEKKDSFTFREPALPILYDSQIIERCLVQNAPITAGHLLQQLNINGLPSTPNLVTDYDNKVITCPKWQETAVNHHRNLSIFRSNNANIANKNSLFSLAAQATIHLAKKGIKGNQNPDLLECETEVITRYKRFPVLFPLSQTQQDTVNLYNHLNSIADTMRRH